MRLLLFAVVLLPAPALAATRTVATGTFERVRIEGPFEVRIATGASPRATIEGGADQIERVAIDTNGTTLTVRQAGGPWGESPKRAATTPVTVTLGTPRLTSLAVLAGGRAQAGALVGDRLDLSVTGTGGITVDSVTARTDLVALVIGSGAITLGGKAARARLIVNGPGTIAGDALVANDLNVRLDGAGEVRAEARYTAAVSTSGLGKVTVFGAPKCQVRAAAGGPVVCGAKREAAASEQ